mmetsp:Transcript_333/g.805  ORF Transcript_333/g.805 Transcript_333/m.805 type:complete len:234 (+) Transcript_333:170-871(+)
MTAATVSIPKANPHLGKPSTIGTRSFSKSFAKRGGLGQPRPSWLQHHSCLLLLQATSQSLRPCLQSCSPPNLVDGQATPLWRQHHSRCIEDQEVGTAFLVSGSLLSKIGTTAPAAPKALLAPKPAWQSKGSHVLVTKPRKPPWWCLARAHGQDLPARKKSTGVSPCDGGGAWAGSSWTSNLIGNSETPRKSMTTALCSCSSVHWVGSPGKLPASSVSPMATKVAPLPIKVSLT